MPKLTSPLVWGGIAAAVALTVMITVAERTRRDVRRSIDAVNHTLDVQKAFNLVLKDMLDAETGQRGFLLTGSASYLPPYRQAERSFAAHLTSLESLTADDAHHRERVGQLLLCHGKNARVVADDRTGRTRAARRRGGRRRHRTRPGVDGTRPRAARSGVCRRAAGPPATASQFERRVDQARAVEQWHGGAARRARHLRAAAPSTAAAAAAAGDGVRVEQDRPGWRRLGLVRRVPAPPLRAAGDAWTLARGGR